MKKPKRFTVHYCAAVMRWQNVEAKSKAEAIEKCNLPKQLSLKGPGCWVAEEEKEK